MYITCCISRIALKYLVQLIVSNPNPVPGPSQSRKRKTTVQSFPAVVAPSQATPASATSGDSTTPALPGRKRKTNIQSNQRVSPPLQSQNVSEDLHALKELLEGTNNGELYCYWLNIIFIIYILLIYLLFWLLLFSQEWPVFMGTWKSSAKKPLMVGIYSIYP